MTASLNDIIARGPTGSRPAAGIAGRLWFDTTTNKLYRDSGLTWVDVDLRPSALSHTHAVGELAQSGATSGQVPVWNGTAWAPANQTATVNLTIDGGGFPLLAGIRGDYEMPWTGTITGAKILADQTGSAVVDLWLAPFAAFPPTVSSTITGSAKPTLATALAATVDISSWSKSFTKGDILRVKLDSASTLTRVTVTLALARSL